MNQPFPDKEIEDLIFLYSKELTKLGINYTHSQVSTENPELSPQSKINHIWTYYFRKGVVIVKIRISYPRLIIDCYINKDKSWFSFEDYLKIAKSDNIIEDAFAKVCTKDSLFTKKDYISLFLKVLSEHCANDEDFRDVLLGKKWIKVRGDLMGHK